jgi:hypothetical protein
VVCRYLLSCHWLTSAPGVLNAEWTKVSSRGIRGAFMTHEKCELNFALKNTSTGIFAQILTKQMVCVRAGVLHADSTGSSM